MYVLACCMSKQFVFNIFMYSFLKEISIKSFQDFYSLDELIFYFNKIYNRIWEGITNNKDMKTKLNLLQY